MTDRSDGAPPDPLDRIKAPERRVHQRAQGDAPDTDQQGRAALFTDRQRREALITVHCSRCEVTSPVAAGTALRSALPLFLLAPWRDHPVFAVCPACRRRSWLRPGVETRP